MDTLPVWQRIRLGTPNTIHESPPLWAEFLLELGARMYVEARNVGRTYIIVLLPTRICASAITALSVLTAAAEKGIVPLSQEEFLALPLGSKVISFRTQDGKKKARAWLIRPGQNQALRLLVSGGKKHFIYSDSLDQEQIFSETAAKPKKLTLLKNVARFYQSLTGKPGDMWPYVSRCECVVVTNRAKWKRELEDLQVQACPNGVAGHRVDISKALMFGDNLDNGHVRVLLSSHGDDQPDVACTTPVILDGPDAFLCHYAFSAKCILCLLDKSEYDEALEQEIRQLMNRRTDMLPQELTKTKATVSHGLDMLAFTLEEDAI